jgi:hypothetical protein
MSYSKLLKSIILLCLFIATIGTGYIFMVTIIFRDKTYAGFYNSWQFPMLLAIFIDSAYYKHITQISL